MEEELLSQNKFIWNVLSHLVAGYLNLNSSHNRNAKFLGENFGIKDTAVMIVNSDKAE